MKKFLIATHGYLADGIKSSLSVLTGAQDAVTYINAYVDESDYTPQIRSFIDSVEPDDQAIIFTDLFGGSVFQKVILEMGEKGVLNGVENVFHVTGVNLALVIELVLSDEELTPAYLEEVISSAREAMCLVRFASQGESQDEPEDDFFG